MFEAVSAVGDVRDGAGLLARFGETIEKSSGRLADALDGFPVPARNAI